MRQVKENHLLILFKNHRYLRSYSLLCQLYPSFKHISISSSNFSNLILLFCKGKMISGRSLHSTQSYNYCFELCCTGTRIFGRALYTLTSPSQTLSSVLVGISSTTGTGSPPKMTLEFFLIRKNPDNNGV